MKIKRHVPNAVSGVDAKIVDFNTVEELLKIDFVWSFSRQPFNKEEAPNKYFKRYSISGYATGMFGDDIILLMAEYDTDEVWKEAFWVIGYISKFPHEELDLPQWEKDNENNGDNISARND